MSSSRELIDDVFNRWEKVFGGYSELRLTLTQKEADIFELDSFLRSSANGGIASDIDDQEEISRVKDFVAKIATHDLGFMKTLEVLTTIVNSYKNIAQGVDCEECGGTGESDTECYECDGQGEFIGVQIRMYCLSNAKSVMEQVNSKTNVTLRAVFSEN